MPVAPTIYQVAREAGVSIATVSRALRRPGDLRPATRDRVLRAVADLGYVPSGPAHGLATGRTRVLGLARAGVSDAEVEEGHETLLFSDEVLRGMERSARLAGYAVLLASADDAGRRFDLELAAKTDGMVVLARTMPAEGGAARPARAGGARRRLRDPRRRRPRQRRQRRGHRGGHRPPAAGARRRAARLPRRAGRLAGRRRPLPGVPGGPGGVRPAGTRPAGRGAGLHRGRWPRRHARAARRRSCGCQSGNDHAPKG
jgi:hypothetical protein